MNISICIPTYKRPACLQRLLESLSSQHSNPANNLVEFVIADNDSLCSARAVVMEWRSRCLSTVAYINVPDANISAARNAAISVSKFETLLFLDDDQWAPPQLLNWLFTVWPMASTKCSLGLLNLTYLPESATRKSLLKAQCFAAKTGTPGAQVTLESFFINFIAKRSVFDQRDQPFPLQYGLSSGEDFCFFLESVRRGHNFIHLGGPAIVEYIPFSRLSLWFILKRAYGGGVAYISWRPLQRSVISKSYLPLPLYVFVAGLLGIGSTVIGLILLPMKPGYGIVLLEKAAKRAGIVFGFFGLKWSIYVPKNSAVKTLSPG